MLNIFDICDKSRKNVNMARLLKHYKIANGDISL